MTSHTPDSKLCNFITLWELIKTRQNFAQSSFSIKWLKLCDKNRTELFLPQFPFNINTTSNRLFQEKSKQEELRISLHTSPPQISPLFSLYKLYNSCNLFSANRAFPLHVTMWNVPKYGVFSAPYFPTFGLNTERY